MATELNDSSAQPTTGAATFGPMGTDWLTKWQAGVPQWQPHQEEDVDGLSECTAASGSELQPPQEELGGIATTSGYLRDHGEGIVHEQLQDSWGGHGAMPAAAQEQWPFWPGTAVQGQPQEYGASGTMTQWYPDFEHAPVAHERAQQPSLWPEAPQPPEQALEMHWPPGGPEPPQPREQSHDAHGPQDGQGQPQIPGSAEDRRSKRKFGIEHGWGNAFAEDVSRAVRQLKAARLTGDAHKIQKSESKLVSYNKRAGDYAASRGLVWKNKWPKDESVWGAHWQDQQWPKQQSQFEHGWETEQWTE